MSSPASIEWSVSREAPSPAARCVSLPFTAPALISMRVRPASHGSTAAEGSLEMLLSNPAGGRGVYIARWSALRAFAAPSLHDIMLAERVATCVAAGETLAPCAVHEAALAVAAQGHGGRRMTKAAAAALEAGRLGHRRLRAHLLLELARRLSLPGSHSALNDPWSTQPQEHSGWLSEAPAQLVRHLPLLGLRGRSAPWNASELADAMDCVAKLAWPIGVGPNAGDARLPRILRLLSQRGGHGGAKLVEARLARHAEAEAALVQARALLADPLGLLTAWREDRPALLRRLQETDWLLDGWDRLCLLLGDATGAAAQLQMLLYTGESDKILRRTELEAPGALAICGAAAGFELLSRNEAIRLRELLLYDPQTASLDGVDLDG